MDGIGGEAAAAERRVKEIKSIGKRGRGKGEGGRGRILGDAHGK